jgi:hypothetical protein
MTPRQSAEDALNRAANGERVLLGTAVVNFVGVLFLTVAAFGFELSAVQQDAIWQLIAAFSVLVWTGGFWIRKGVPSQVTLEREVEAAKEAGRQEAQASSGVE